MHHGILIKVRGNSLEHARTYADSVINETICCPNCGASRANVNWDYYTFVEEVTDEQVKKHPVWQKSGIDSVEKLPEYYRSVLNNAEKDIRDRIYEAYERLYDEDGEIIEFSMLGFYLNKLETVRNIKEYGEADEHFYTLHCTENHFADLTEDGYEGDKTFWLWYDRHY